MSRADYLAALHGALDARRDPLDDAIVLDWLTAYPEDLPEFAAMRAALAAPAGPQLISVPLAPPPPRRLRWPLLFPPLAAAAALLLFLRADRLNSPPPAPELSGAVLAVYEAISVAPAENPSAASSGAAVLDTSVRYQRTSTF